MLMDIVALWTSMPMNDLVCISLLLLCREWQAGSLMTRSGTTYKRHTDFGFSPWPLFPQNHSNEKELLAAEV
jgi:hypothetical protein